jgi:hypothetical protein
MVCGLLPVLSACTGAGLNPAFVDLLDPELAAGLETLDNAPGHVVVSVINKATIDERLLSYLESAEGGNLTLTDAERQDLRPRIRLRLRVTFVDGTFQTIEFVDGSSLIEGGYDPSAYPDLTGNDLINAVVICNVATVELEPGSQIEVFMPVELTGYELVETSGTGNVITTTFEPRERTDPEFRALEIDETDADGNVTLSRNIGIREVPSPPINPLCGSNIVLLIDGVLTAPFLDGVSDAPSYDRDDETTVARIGGRFQFLTSVQ